MLKNTSHCQKTRDKIASSQILKRLLKHFEGELDLSPTQVNVGLKLLNKVVPDLKQVEAIQEVNHKLPQDIKITLVSADEWS